jgi:hypothetical protein
VDGIGVVVLVLAVLAVAGVVYANHRRTERKRQSLARLVARDGLRATTTPCGLDAAALRGIAGLPRGDRRHGVRWGVEGPLRCRLAGAEQDLHAGAFQWFWEERRTQQTQNGTQTTYQERSTTAVLVDLPCRVPHRIVLRPESVLGRVGLTRGGHQLESSEFNRRFRVECADRTWTIHLLDPGMQELLTTAFAGRTLDLHGQRLALVGRPDHRDPTLEGVVGELPAVRQDVARLLGAIPPAFWRAAGWHPA